MAGTCNEVPVIDDLGYVQQSREEMEVLFTLLADRYERGSVWLTSNLPFSKWESIFKDPMTTAAAIDRLVHHSVIVELNLPSYRLEHARRRTVLPRTPACRAAFSDVASQASVITCNSSALRLLGCGTAHLPRPG
jgi:hypothetical protein